MKQEYGVDWFIKAPLTMNYKSYTKGFSSFHFHELISLLIGYPCLTNKFTLQVIIQLQETIPIRNKIAHCKIITYHDYEKLQEVNKLVRDTIEYCDRIEPPLS
ncbi:hypothetical protein [Salinibacillus kushneri]|uniref:hypothetical protein n=1 Tax=Salinibacillus kushneri TaxID=237682 RepID=UPI000B879DDF|nr:hypothetical protein [Salinibacillus kushneri]